MPQLPPVQTRRRLPPPPPSVSQCDTVELLVSVRDDPLLPVSLKEKLDLALGHLRKGSMSSSPGLEASWKSCTPFQRYFKEMTSSVGPLHRLVCGAAGTVRARDFDVSLRVPGVAAVSPKNSLFQRSAPALQDHQDTFEEMNGILFQTLRYIDEVEELEFDITNVREYDGSLMHDRERLFLSICCSVFSNFSFCSTLHLNIGKFVRFLGDIFVLYPNDNAYHNATHAADALQMMSLFLREPTVNFMFTDEEIAICFLSVLALDVVHPGASDEALAVVDHPLVSIFGDIAVAEHASLLVFINTLMREENFFFRDMVGTGAVNYGHAVRELIYYTVLNAAPSSRPSLLAALSEVQAQRCVRHEDTPKLMSALLIMAHSSFAFRSQKQFYLIGSWMVSEMYREETEMHRHNTPCLLPRVNSTDGSRILGDYVSSILQPVVHSIRALVPTDLYDRLEDNSDSVDDFAGDLHLLQSGQPWSTNATAVMEILKRVAAHAYSVDRKASKCAILNASPQRPSDNVSVDSREELPSSAASTSSPIVGGYVGTVASPQNSFSSSSRFLALSNTPTRLSRSEHYFSFLRLYDKCERGGESVTDFLGQLIFLALQLEPRYIGAYARREFGEGCNARECAKMGFLIIQTEEAPSSAEVIVSHRPGGSFSSRKAEENDFTDGFILFLMDMYCSRGDATSEAMETLDTRDGERLSLRPPHPTGAASQQFRQNSPIRMPVSTDSKVLGSSDHPVA